MYSKLKELKKFTTKDEIDNIIGNPKFQIEDRLVYYYGKGIFVAYTLYCFKMKDDERIKYGEVGEYAVSVYHFADVEMLKLNFGLASFEADDIERFDDGVIDGEITYKKTFAEVQKMDIKNEFADCYIEGERRRFVNGKMQVINLFIMYGTYTLFFRGHSKKDKISGFEYTLCE